MLELVKKAVTQGELIISRDNPKRVDMAVIEEGDCVDREILVFGIALQSKKGSRGFSQYHQFNFLGPDWNKSELPPNH